jgi:hypothetical protein
LQGISSLKYKRIALRLGVADNTIPIPYMSNV